MLVAKVGMSVTVVSDESIFTNEDSIGFTGEIESINAHTVNSGFKVFVAKIVSGPFSVNASISDIIEKVDPKHVHAD